MREFGGISYPYLKLYLVKFCLNLVKHFYHPAAIERHWTSDAFRLGLKQLTDRVSINEK